MVQCAAGAAASHATKSGYLYFQTLPAQDVAYHAGQEVLVTLRWVHLPSVDHRRRLHASRSAENDHIPLVLHSHRQQHALAATANLSFEVAFETFCTRVWTTGDACMPAGQQKTITYPSSCTVK